MNKDKVDIYEYNRKVAELKYGLIAPVITATYTDMDQMSYFKRVSTLEIEWVDGTRKKFSWETIKNWFYQYKHGGIEALQPNIRNDHGSSRVLNAEVQQRIQELVKEFPKITGVMIYEKIIQEGLITKKDTSLSTIQRYIKNNLKNGRGSMPAKEIRTWEYEHALDGYEADTCHTLYIYDGEDGEYRKTYLIAIIDNHSRMIVGARFFFHDSAVNFQQVWKEAVLRYGRSKVMILDNGSAYKSRENQRISASIGTRIIYNPPYSPTGKALIERFFLTIKERWLNVEHGKDYHSLEALNEKLREWLSEYNRSEHSALQKDKNNNHSPLQRFMYDMKDSEPWKLVNKQQCEYDAWVDECFLYEETRKVNGDSTVVIQKCSFDVPSQYIGTRVIIRYDPVNFKTIYLYDPASKTKTALKETDKVENGKTRRTEIIY